MTDRDHATLPAADEPTNDDSAEITDEMAEDTDTVAAALGEAVPVAHDGVSAVTHETVGAVSQVLEPAPEPEDLLWAESAGAVVLGVLPPENMAAAGQAIARSPQLQNEVAALLPVADILLSLYQTQPAPVTTAEPAVPASLADRPVVERAAPSVSRRVERPLREVTARTAGTGFGGLTASTILIGVLALAAAIGLLWALALSDKVATRDDEIAALKRQVTEFRQAANASAFSLTPTEDGAENARGTVFYSIADSKVLLDVTGLPELDEDRVYQVWFQRSGGGDWEPGPTFRVNTDGESVQRLPGETPTFIRIAISDEPAPGSAEPSGPFLLEGALAGANG